MLHAEYVIIGGGVSGVGALKALRERSVSSVVLLEARNRLGYTLSWMSSVPHSAMGQEYNGADGVFTDLTGAEFAETDLVPMVQDDAVRLKTRVFSVNLADRVVHTINETREYEGIEFSHLLVAPGAVQVLYGRHLLPGRRSNRLFTTYQAGEMMANYPFLPGRKPIVYGSSPYTVETVYAAVAVGIEPTVVVPGVMSGELRTRLPGVPIFENAVITSVQGDRTFSGIEVDRRGDREKISGDALIIDGDFVLERQWRERLGVVWDLDGGFTRIPRDHPFRDVFTVIGDAAQPDPVFLRQFERAQNIVRELQYKKKV